MDHNVRARWEHFSHGSDIGIRGYGRTQEEAFEQAALALTAVVCDLKSVRESTHVPVACHAPDIELLFLDWIDGIIYEMGVRQMLFCRYTVSITGASLSAFLGGETIDWVRHEPAVEVKGATFTELHVDRDAMGQFWRAQCVVDV